MTDKLIRTLGLLNSLPYLNNTRTDFFQCQIVLYEHGSFNVEEMEKAAKA